MLPLLRPGRVNKRLNVFGLMKRVITEIRRFWKDTVIFMRGDSMFCSHEFMEWSKMQHHVQFMTGLTGNKVLNEKSEPWVSRARDDFRRDGKPVKRYYRHMYRAGSWNEPQWVITKVEYNSMGYNVRHVVTSMGCKDRCFMPEVEIHIHNKGQKACVFDGYVEGLPSRGNYNNQNMVKQAHLTNQARLVMTNVNNAG